MKADFLDWIARSSLTEADASYARITYHDSATDVGPHVSPEPKNPQYASSPR